MGRTFNKIEISYNLKRIMYCQNKISRTSEKKMERLNPQAELPKTKNQKKKNKIDCASFVEHILKYTAVLLGFLR